jgi:hypothetical protein
VTARTTISTVGRDIGGAANAYKRASERALIESQKSQQIIVFYIYLFDLETCEIGCLNYTLSVGQRKKEGVK